MTTLHYYIMDPTKNITALVETPVPPASRPFAASQIMKAEPDCEQVGFLSRTEAGETRLDMAGGEFCGNASMSAAALICAKEGLRQGQRRSLTLRVSGAASPVEVCVSAADEGVFDCTVTMPSPERITEETLPLGDQTINLPAVFLPGIAHIIATKDELTEGDAERLVKDWCRILKAAALGVMLFDEKALTLRPMVYVPAADTLFWESSCASGSAAVGAYLSEKSGAPVELCLNEPGGTLRVNAAPGGVVCLSGQVTVRSERTVVC